MSLFYRYIKQNRRGIVLFLSYFGIFLIYFCVYHLPVKAVGFPLLLCIVLGLLLVYWDFRHIRKKHGCLTDIQNNADIVKSNLPKADWIEEEDYQQIIRSISEEYQMHQEKENRKYQDMIDYYTVWVHQIEIPIASIKLRLQNEESDLSQKLMMDLHRVEQYVEMVLIFLKLNSESRNYQIQQCDLDLIIRQVIRKFTREFTVQKISLHYESRPVVVVTDEKWLTFVIEQVLSNALKYTTQGSITISIDKDKKLKIRDTGIGIELQDIPHVFENSYTGYDEGMGKTARSIGLYLCKCICKDLGHEISVKSVVNLGTIITIDLSRQVAE